MVYEQYELEEAAKGEKHKQEANIQEIGARGVEGGAVAVA